MKHLLLELSRAVASGEAGTLVTIVEKSGSTPRGVGTAMVVLSDGATVGTIGGGEMEYRARKHAMERMPDWSDETVAYEIHSDSARQTGGASGRVNVLFRRFQGDSAKALLDQALEAIECDCGAWLGCPIRQGTAGQTRLVASAELTSQFSWTEIPNASVLLTGETDWFFEPLFNDPRVLLFGGGHVAQKTALQFALLDYRVWVLEERPAFADAALFPTVERILCAPFERATELLSICSRDHAIVMTSSHETDDRVLRWLLTTPVDYIGCIGSRKKIARTKDRLLQSGFDQAQFARIHAPVGLDIGAETPAEIAVSIAAELIAYRRSREAE